MMRPRLIVWPPLPLGVYTRRPVGRLPWPLEEPNCRIFARARRALYEGVRALGLGEGDAVLVPAYHHGSEIEALHCAGVTLRFYDCDGHLAPDAAALDRLLSPDVRALYLTHFLGLPQNSARWRAWADEHGLQLIEDAAQGWLGMSRDHPVGGLADLVVFCLYKTYGLPDGGAVWSTMPPPHPTDRAPSGYDHALLRNASYVAQRSGIVAAMRRRIGRDRPYDPQRDFVLGERSAPFVSTPRLLARVVSDDTAARRLANYRVLERELGPQMPPEFGVAPDGASPFGFPVESRDKRVLLARLAESGIVALNFWATPHPLLDQKASPRASSLRERVVVVPVHQELRTGDLERIADAVRAARVVGARAT